MEHDCTCSFMMRIINYNNSNHNTLDSLHWGTKLKRWKTSAYGIQKYS